MTVSTSAETANTRDTEPEATTRTGNQAHTLHDQRALHDTDHHTQQHDDRLVVLNN